jgi:hypothetical protein
MNPYVAITLTKFTELREALLSRDWGWLLHHMISASGEVFLTVLKNEAGELEVSSATANL